MAYDLSGVNIPFDSEAEQAVLGSILSDGSCIAEVIGNLHPEHFYVELNREIFQVMSQMYMSGDSIEMITVKNYCLRQAIFENEQEAKKYFRDLVEVAFSPSQITTYADLIIEKYMLRSLILASKEIIDAANTAAEPANKIMDFAEQKIYDIREGVENKSLTHISGIIFDRLNELNDLVKTASANGGKPVMTGLSTGFRELDKKIYGLNRSDLIILAARPAMGKTSLAMNMAVQVAKKYRDKQICVFSLEMSKEQIVSRMISAEAMLSSDAMKTGNVPINKWNDITTSVEILSQLGIYVDDTPGCNVMSIKSKLRRMKNLGLVIIDHLQLMTSVDNYHGNRVAEMSEITRNLKIMAKELNVPVIALSQLARATEQRPDKKPMLSDLRDSGSIEQDADIVLFLYRESYYDKSKPDNQCECIVAKNRHGEVGSADLGWNGEFTKFFNAEIRKGNQ